MTQHTLNKPFYPSNINPKPLSRLFRIIPLIIAFLLIPSCAYAYIDQEAIRAIIGESSNQGKIGMLKVASAIRNRGTLKGVYGLKAKHVDKEPQWVWDMAREAWQVSLYKDYSNGATHWENIKVYGKPYWVKSMIKVDEYKDHIFYKETL